MKTKLHSPSVIHHSSSGSIGSAFLAAIVLLLITTRSSAQTGFGSAAVFDGAGDYITVTPTPALDLGTGTIEFWVKPGALAGRACILANRSYPHATTTRYCINMTTSSIGLDNATNYQSVACAFTAGTWYHVALVGSPTNTEVFVDGVSRGFTGNCFTPDVPGQRRFTIGATYADAGPLTNAFTGQLDEVRIWNTARTVSEIRAGKLQPLTGTEPGLVAYYRFNEATGSTSYDSTANHLDGMLIGNTAWAASGVLERTLALVADATQYAWTTSGNNIWAGQTLVSHDGVDAARSGVITNSQSSSFQAVVAGPTTLSFWWKVSSETGFDFLQVYVDNVKQAEISGEVNWQRRTVDLAAGNHTVRWTYTKDGSVNSGQDAGFVDQVESNPLALALDTPQLSWVTSGNANWVYQTAVRHDGADAARSGTITHNGSSILETIVTGPGVMSFWWKVSSEPNYDFLRYYLDGVQQTSISGEVDWQLVRVCIPPGDHTLRWAYTKDGSINTGSDASFLDQMVWSPGVLTILAEPIAQTTYVGGTVRFSVNAGSPAPLSYQWRFNGLNLANGGRIGGATSNILTITGAQMADVGHYSVLVGDTCGAMPSASVELAVGTLGSLFDDFEPGIHLPQWAGFSGTVLATNYGGSVSGVKSLWFGGDGPRFAASRPLDTTRGGVVDFYLRFANGTAYPWEFLDLPANGTVLEYSTDGGGTWVEMGRYDSAAYYNWTHVSANIPAAAQTFSTQFRWRQISHDGNNFDHWALDDVATISLPPPALLTGCSLAAPGLFQLHGTGTAGLTYTVQISTNLVDWVDHTSVVAGAGGAIVFQETMSANVPVCFYRLVWP